MEGSQELELEFHALGRICPAEASLLPTWSGAAGAGSGTASAAGGKGNKTASLTQTSASVCSFQWGCFQCAATTWVLLCFPSLPAVSPPTSTPAFAVLLWAGEQEASVGWVWLEVRGAEQHPDGWSYTENGPVKSCAQWPRPGPVGAWHRLSQQVQVKFRPVWSTEGAAVGWIQAVSGSELACGLYFSLSCFNIILGTWPFFLKLAQNFHGP